MNKIIFKLIKNINNNKVVSNLNRIKLANMNSKNKLENSRLFITKMNHCNPFIMNKRNFSTFSNFPIPPNPEDPNILFIFIIATIGYIVVKKIN